MEFRRNIYFLDLILAREARHEKLYNEAKANKTHWIAVAQSPLGSKFSTLVMARVTGEQVQRE